MCLSFPIILIMGVNYSPQLIPLMSLVTGVGMFFSVKHENQLRVLCDSVVNSSFLNQP